MQKNTFYLTQLIYRLLCDSELSQAVSGSVFREIRPVGSDREDVIVNSEPVSMDAPQKAIVRVGIYLPPTIGLLPGGNVKQSIPDYGRFELLSNLVVEALASSSSYGCVLELQSEELKEQSDVFYMELSFEASLYEI